MKLISFYAGTFGTLRGRLGRWEFAWRFLVLAVLAPVLLSVFDLIADILGTRMPADPASMLLLRLSEILIRLGSAVLASLTAYGLIAIGVRRLHDVSISGGWLVADALFRLITLGQAIHLYISAADVGGDYQRSQYGYAGALIALNLVISLAWFLYPGTKGANPYGERPNRAQQKQEIRERLEPTL